VTGVSSLNSALRAFPVRGAFFCYQVVQSESSAFHALIAVNRQNIAVNLFAAQQN
jgi:hypothetical protein